MRSLIIFIQEVEEVEEIRVVAGRRYINRFLLQHDDVIESYIYDTVSGALEPRHKRCGDYQTDCDSRILLLSAQAAVELF